ncbi:uncharacterized protein JCM6883_002323 [Sporobolomyces salmoneus]|uniref:uncharacterized protein n=1 Tax=Sporobolomyces salmoneus TaxID=183962 RepID=UPI00317A01AC
MSGSLKNSATALKAQGNVHFAAKEWEKAITYYTKALEAETTADSKAPLYSNRSAALVHLDRLGEAFTDAKECIQARPNWSKAHARLGEVLARRQLFDESIVAYENAVARAEDPAAKSRYATAIKTTKSTRDRNRTTYTKMSGKSYTTEAERMPVHKLAGAISGGFKPRAGGSLELLIHAYQIGLEGMKHLEENIYRVNGRDAGNAGTNTSQELSECILLDGNAFIIPAGGDPSYPLIKKFSALQRLDVYGLGLLKYYESIPNAKTIISDLNRERTSGKDWLDGCSVFIRGSVLTAFIAHKNKDYAAAIDALRFSLAVLDEGNRVWRNVEIDDKGNSFRPTLKRMIKAYLMETQIDASRDAFSDSAKKVFTLDNVEATAQEILAENPQGEWPPAAPSSVQRLGFYVLPTARAYIALGYVWSQRARVALIEKKISKGGVALAKFDEARKSARYYDLGAKFLPDDDFRKPQTLFMALQEHLRAGGKKVSEVFKLAEEAEKLRVELSKFYESLNGSYAPRDFVNDQVKALNEYLASPGPKGGDPILKPIPTLNLRGTPKSFNPNSVLNAQFWSNLPGEVGLVDVLGFDREVKSDFA